MQAEKTLLNIDSLVKSYPSGSGRVEVLKSLSMKVNEGELIAIMGPSGSGKSTLLHCIAGLTELDSGEIMLDNEDISKFNDSAKTALRREKIGLIFQSFNLLANLSVKDNICLPIYANGKKPDMKLLEEICQSLEISDKLQRYPSSLSGGEQQRVAIARVFMLEPRLILADEPTGSLDSVTGQALCKQLKNYSKKLQKTILLITHEPAVALWADKVLVLLDGKITGSFTVEPEMQAKDLSAKYCQLAE